MNVRGSSRMALVLWLLLAILPLRGWAGAVMHLPGHPSAEVVAAMPCHGEDVDLGGDPASDTACTLCDLCHGGVALATAPVPDVGDLRAQGLPAASVPSALQIDDGALYRPPRR